MRKILPLIFIYFYSVGYTQNSGAELEEIVHAERTSASKTMNITVNQNTLNYDVIYHQLEFKVNPSLLDIEGKVLTKFKALENMNTIVFDFYKSTTRPFTINSVKQGGVNLTFTHKASHELEITFPSPIVAGTETTIEIVYNGRPPSTNSGAYIVSQHAGKPILWTLSEPYGAREWWPCKQDLNDKVDSLDVYINSPSSYTSVSNGVQQSRIINGSNAITHFHHGYPIPAYLIAIAVTDYSIINQQAGLGTTASPFFPVVNYVYPESQINAANSLQVTPSILNFYESIIGPYPFRDEKYGHAQFGAGGGMEHTTVSFMSNFSRSLIAHEMAHQWFGDKVTCGTWKDIWLNEGITEFMAGCVVEHLDGQENFKAWKTAKIQDITSRTGGYVYLKDEDLTNSDRIFSSRLSYNKGAMVNNMLRFIMGKENYYKALRNYLSDPTLAYKYAITPQYKAHLEAVHGSSLEEFFQDWVYKEGYPIYTISTSLGVNSNTVNVQISQRQSNPSVTYFELPVPLRFVGANGQVFDTVLNNTVNGQTYQVNVPFEVVEVLFDVNKELISKNNEVSLATNSFELENQIKVYPNPVSNQLSLEIPSSIDLKEVKIYNPLGQLVSNHFAKNIDVTRLENGVYTISIITSKGAIHKSFIKK